MRLHTPHQTRKATQSPLLFKWIPNELVHITMSLTRMAAIKIHACNHARMQGAAKLGVYSKDFNTFPSCNLTEHKHKQNDLLNHTRIWADIDLLPRITCWLRATEAFSLAFLRRFVSSVEHDCVAADRPLFDTTKHMFTSAFRSKCNLQVQQMSEGSRGNSCKWKADSWYAQWKPMFCVPKKGPLKGCIER